MLTDIEADSLDDILHEVAQLALPDAVVVVLDDGLVTPAKTEQVHRKHPIPHFYERWDVGSPVVRGRSKPMDQKDGRAVAGVF